MLFSTKNLIRLMLLTIIVLAFLAGFFQSSLEVEKRRSKYFQNKLIQLEKQTEKTEL